MTADTGAYCGCAAGREKGVAACCWGEKSSCIRARDHGSSTSMGAAARLRRRRSRGGVVATAMPGSTFFTFSRPCADMSRGVELRYEWTTEDVCE